MIWRVLVFLLALSACGGPPAAPNPMSVPNVLQSITEARAQPGVLFINGGLYDGAAAGQTTRLVVLPDGRLICTFQTDPVFPGDPPEPVVTAHRLQVPNLYQTLTAVLVPNVETTQVEFTTNFQIDFRQAGGVTTTRTGFGDRRFTLMMGVFNQFPTPCWAFG